MRKGEIAAIVDAPRESQGFIDACERAVRAQRLPLKLCEQHGIEPNIGRRALIGQGRLRTPNFGRAGGGVMETAARPPGMQFSPDAPELHPMLPAEALQGLSRAQRRSGVAAQYFEKGFPAEGKSHRRGVAE